MKILIAYYSRTGTTKKAVEALAPLLGADLEEIQDSSDYKGAFGYLRAGKLATQRRLAELKPSQYDPSAYDLVILATPIWSWNLSVPVRSYLSTHQKSLHKVALLATMGGSGVERAAQDAEKILGQTLVASLGLLTKEVYQGQVTDKLKDFALKLTK